MIRNIVFDLGNVLLSFLREEFLSRFTDDPADIDKFVSNVQKTQTWLDMDKGILTVPEAIPIFRERLPGMEDLVDRYFENWMEIFNPIEENIALIPVLQNHGYRVFLLSNFIREAFAIVKPNFEFFSIVDGMVISGFEGTIKPERAIYLLLLNKYGLKAEECLFIDDQIPFLTPAREMGFHTIHFLPGMDLVTLMRDHGIELKGIAR